MEDNHTPEHISDPESARLRQSDGAVFLGWQNMPRGEPIALYNVTAPSHPLHGSTVTGATLREHNVPIPETPAPMQGEGHSGRFDSDQQLR